MKFNPKAFCAFDTDSSGAINEHELVDAMNSLNMNTNEKDVKEMIMAVDVDGISQQLDILGDGDISIDEFIKLMVKIRAKSRFLQNEEQIQEAFDMLDEDGDG